MHGTDDFQDIRDAVRSLCAKFPDEYHRRIDEARAYREDFVEALTRAGRMAALIPEEYGGSGLGLTEASVIMEEINRAGGNSGACLQFHGGFGFAREYDIKRKFRETRLYQVAPISTNLILSYVAEHMLGLPRSFCCPFPLRA